MIGVLLPDTTTSTRYVPFDRPYLTKAFEAAGLTTSDFKIDNAQGSAATMQTQAEADITDGAIGAARRPPRLRQRRRHRGQRRGGQGVKVIDYDRLVKGGPADRYYVSFDNVKVGKLIGQGEVDCIAAWNVAKPNVLVMDGDPTDNNATLFAQGYNGVLKPKFDDGTLRQGRRAGRDLDPVGRGHDLRAAVHRPPEHQRRRHPERRQRQRRHRRAAEERHPGQEVPDHRSGRLAAGPAEHPEGLPVRHRLQADLPRGPGRGGARALPAGRPGRRRRRWSTATTKDAGQQGRPVGATPRRSG